MRLTQEADCALRIVYYLTDSKEKTGAKSIAEQSAVPERFCVKILRKLTAADIVKSYKGALGGYLLAREPKDISLKDIIEAVEGPVEIHRCLDSEYCCPSNGAIKGECAFHIVFDRINGILSGKLSAVTMDKMAGGQDGIDEIIKIIG